MWQEWRALTFLHWRFPVRAVAARVPSPLEVDTFDGAAWVAVTPFLLALRWAKFPETNCRTYVRGPDGERGVWFFSLDAARAIAVAGARIGYGLPYAWSRMRVETGDGCVRYESRRRWPDRTAMTRIEVRPEAPIASGEIETFLTARFRLYSFIRGRLTYTQVEHPPWPLHAARVTHLEQTLTGAAGLPQTEGTPIAYFSPSLQVRVFAPQLV